MLCSNAGGWLFRYDSSAQGARVRGAVVMSQTQTQVESQSPPDRTDPLEPLDFLTLSLYGFFLVGLSYFGCVRNVPCKSVGLLVQDSGLLARRNGEVIRLCAVKLFAVSRYPENSLCSVAKLLYSMLPGFKPEILN